MTPEALRQWRAVLGLTQAEAADLLGYTRTHYAHMESGSVAIHPLLPMACAAHYRDLDPWPDIYAPPSK